MNICYLNATRLSFLNAQSAERNLRIKPLLVISIKLLLFV
uniref:Uncharacterized protein n=1 Tax=Ascaris lumbricoides TaxID=6252 RepID=A0A0M3IMY5_ASCLU